MTPIFTIEKLNQARIKESRKLITGEQDMYKLLTGNAFTTRERKVPKKGTFRMERSSRYHLYKMIRFNTTINGIH